MFFIFVKENLIQNIPLLGISVPIILIPYNFNHKNELVIPVIKKLNLNSLECLPAHVGTFRAQDM